LNLNLDTSKVGKDTKNSKNILNSDLLKKQKSDSLEDSISSGSIIPETKTTNLSHTIKQIGKIKIKTSKKSE
jgi:hypothetical protein